ncbi:WYL domain-containing protein, partial [Phascolarctobacterium faecium]
MWQLGEAIQQHRYVNITYGRMKDRKVVERRLKPLALLFSEYYFYLIAFIDDSNIQRIYESARDMTPTIYRLDRIKSLAVEKNLFRIPYNRRFQEGEFR